MIAVNSNQINEKGYIFLNEILVRKYEIRAYLLM